MRSAQSLPFSRLDNTSSLSLSSQERCSGPLITSVAFLLTCFNRSTYFLHCKSIFSLRLKVKITHSNMKSTMKYMLLSNLDKTNAVKGKKKKTLARSNWNCSHGKDLFDTWLTAAMNRRDTPCPFHLLTSHTIYTSYQSVIKDRQ